MTDLRAWRRGGLAGRMARLALWLGVGVVVNVGVAGGLHNAHLGEDLLPRECNEALRWPRAAPDGWPQPSKVSRYGRWGVDCLIFADGGKTMWFRRSGAPFRSLSDSYHMNLARIGVMLASQDVWRIGQVELQRTPVWPGFALNTLFYGALAWGASLIPGAIRRRRRRRSGRCIACGYSLAGLNAGAACPECGGQRR